jgi:hypothetical protein
MAARAAAAIVLSAAAIVWWVAAVSVGMSLAAFLRVALGGAGRFA